MEHDNQILKVAAPRQIQMNFRWIRIHDTPQRAESAQDARTSATLVGGFNPLEKHQSKWVHFPQVGVRIDQIVETNTKATASC